MELIDIWEKRLDTYMGDVYFTNELRGHTRELRFAFNSCIDSIYATGNVHNRQEIMQKIIRLDQDYTRYISTQNDIDLNNKLEALIINSDFNFQIPDEFISR